MRRAEKIRFMENELPYGKSVYADGTVEIFNRRYETIYRKGEKTSTKIKEQSFYYSEANSPWRDKNTERRCKQVLRDWFSGNCT